MISVQCAADQDKPGVRPMPRPAGRSRLADDLSSMCWQWPTVVALDGTAVVGEYGHRASRVTSLTPPVGRASASMLAAGPSSPAAAVAVVEVDVLSLGTTSHGPVRASASSVPRITGLVEACRATGAVRGEDYVNTAVLPK